MEKTVGSTEAARRLERGVQQIHRQCWDGRFKGARKIDGRWAIPVSEIEERLKARARAKRS